MKRILATVMCTASIATGAAFAEEPFRIGFAVSLTGYLAAYDTPTVEGAQMAIQTLNAAGGAAGA
jgi:branched-chain amino acid transport system substrate-binding protein